jgi:uncharacterized protein (TIGR02246 family)
LLYFKEPIMLAFVRSITRIAPHWAMVCSLLIPALALSEEEATEAPPESSAIRASIKSYVEAYNQGDAKAVAAHWSDEGEWISPAGERFAGKEAIESALKTLFEESKGTTIAVNEPQIRMVSDDVAIEEGSVIVSSPDALPSQSSYLAVHVKKGGQWKLDSVRETEIPELPARSAELEELSWLVGEWRDEDPEASSEATVAWAKNKTFLTYSFKVAMPDADELEGTQIIGWDPAAGVIRSWMFDSDGGFGEGVWSRKGDSWVVNFSQTLPDGGTAAATNVYTLVDANTFTWKSVGRSVDGELQENVEGVKIVRKTSAVSATREGGDKPAARTAKNRKKNAKN